MNSSIKCALILFSFMMALTLGVAIADKETTKNVTANATNVTDITTGNKTLEGNAATINGNATTIEGNTTSNEGNNTAGNSTNPFNKTKGHLEPF